LDLADAAVVRKLAMLGKIRQGGIASILVALPLVFNAVVAHAETRGYVISWFATASYWNGDEKMGCPEGRNGLIVDMHARELVAIGMDPKEAATLQRKQRDTDAIVPEYRDKVYNRARVNGHDGSVFTYPDFTEDPDIEFYSGQYAYGFDLTGNSSASKFEDPETHEKVDNQLWRALGCINQFRAIPPQKSLLEDTSWDVFVDNAPAWTIQISGDDLSKDGKVTVTIGRATQHLLRDANETALTDATYVIDPASKTHSVLQGEIKNGVLTVNSQPIYLEGELPFYLDIGLDNGHLRAKRQADGKLIGYMGGFTDWKKYAFMSTARPFQDAAAIEGYHALKKLADADPDPATGQNRKISATFRWEAVPAFLADGQGKIVAQPDDAIALQKVATNAGH
jgi:hypothetical protein